MKQKKYVSSLSQKEQRKGWIFVAPFVLGFVFLFVPILVRSVAFSFGDIVVTNDGYTLSWNNFASYHEMLFVNAEVLRTTVSALTETFMQIPLILIFSLFAATLLNQKFPGRGLFRAIFFVPVILSTGVVLKLQETDLLLNSMSSMNGFSDGVSANTAGQLINSLDVQKYVSNISLSPEIINYAVTAANNIYDVVTKSGVQILIFLSALQAISPSIYESAKVEGASGWETFWKITLPMLTPMILANAVFTVVDSFTCPTNTMMKLINDLTFEQSRYGLGGAVAWTYCLIIALCMGLVFLIFRRALTGQQREKR